MAEALNVVPSLIIKELTGERRVLRLTDRALPYRPIAFSGSQRAEFTHYAGSPVATVQILGPKENDTTLRGFWKDRYIAANTISAIASVSSGEDVLGGERLESVEDLVDLVDDMRLQGQLLEVVWGTKARRGILEQFDHVWHNVHDVEWEMKFMWTQQAPKSSGEFVLKMDFSSIGRSWADFLDDLLDAITAPFALLDVLADAINSAVNVIKQTINAVQDAVNAIANSIVAPFAALRRLAGVLNTLKAAAKNLWDTIKSIPGAIGRQLSLASQQIEQFLGSGSGPSTGAFGPTVEAGSSAANSGTTVSSASGSVTASATQTSASAGTVTAGSTTRPTATSGGASGATPTITPAGSGTPGLARVVAPDVLLAGQVIEAEVYLRKIGDVARRMRAEAARQHSEVIKRIEPALIAVFPARENQDLREVSTRYYGTPNEWRRLKMFNGFDGSKLTAGQTVFVPRLEELGEEAIGA
jgi:hypothetical protein